MSGSAVGGRPRDATRDPLLHEWAYFVRVNGFTFEFASLDQLRESRNYAPRYQLTSRAFSGLPTLQNAVVGTSATGSCTP